MPCPGSKKPKRGEAYLAWIQVRVDMARRSGAPVDGVNGETAMSHDSEDRSGWTRVYNPSDSIAPSRMKEKSSKEI